MSDRYLRPRRVDLANFLLGSRLRTDEEAAERLSNPQGLAVFASDALSSVAYAGEQMLRVLVPAVGVVAYGALLPLSGVVAAVLAIVVVSYRQTIRAYPNAGGAYVVTYDNFGPVPAQVAGVGLLIDYVLTVAVSVSAGAAALYSTVPSLYGWRVWLALGFVWVIAGVNLRGIRASGRVFSLPTYVFVASVLAVVAVGTVRHLTGTLPPLAATPGPPAAGGLGLLLLLHAFASGATAMTGVEAVSNGVSAFRPVTWRNARRVLAWLGVLLGAMFLGLSWLAWRLRPPLSPTHTVLSELARASFGHGGGATAGYLVVQAATAAILVLAANTSFADFPRLASFQAHDHFLPEPLRRRGRRLAFSDGIVVLACLASVVVAATGANVNRLIPLYAVGVFLSFTFSQAGMARRHLRLRERHWRFGLAVNGVGAVATAVVLIVVVVTKFAAGAWVVLVVLPVTVVALLGVNRHYREVEAELAAGAPPGPVPAISLHPTRGDRSASVYLRRAHRGTAAGEGVTAALVTTDVRGGRRLRAIDRALTGTHGRVALALTGPAPAWAGAHHVVVLVGELPAPGRAAGAVARGLQAERVRAIHVAEHLDENTDALTESWAAMVPDLPLEVVPAPWREVVTPTLELVRDELRSGAELVTAVVGWVVPHHRWQRHLHNRRARPLVAALIQEPGVVVLAVPHRLPADVRGAAGGETREARTLPGSPAVHANHEGVQT